MPTISKQWEQAIQKASNFMVDNKASGSPSVQLKKLVQEKARFSSFIYWRFSTHFAAYLTRDKLKRYDDHFKSLWEFFTTLQAGDDQKKTDVGHLFWLEQSLLRHQVAPKKVENIIAIFHKFLSLRYDPPEDLRQLEVHILAVTIYYHHFAEMVSSDTAAYVDFAFLKIAHNAAIACETISSHGQVNFRTDRSGIKPGKSKENVKDVVEKFYNNKAKQSPRWATSPYVSDYQRAQYLAAMIKSEGGEIRGAKVDNIRLHIIPELRQEKRISPKPWVDKR